MMDTCIPQVPEKCMAQNTLKIIRHAQMSVQNMLGEYLKWKRQKHENLLEEFDFM